jgi:predicted lipoprotein with Yx(FWY)xxD motif
MSESTPTRPRFASWLPAAAVVVALMLVLGACAAGTTATPSESEAAPESMAAESEAAEPSASEAASEGQEITVSETSAGSALAGEGGMTLYTFDQDSNGESSCYEDCATNWPAFLVDEGEEATAGEGVTGDIGTTERTDGTMQVTYDGAPLYYFAGDTAPGDSNGDGVGDVWHVAVP